jgi:bifunctional DNA-binding transcriptional regulator/antitoxin component of YhaV-PrlF toxin-antitoxin module
MQTRVSSKEQVVLPEPVRCKLGIQARDVLQVSVKSDADEAPGEDRVVLTMPRRKKFETRIVTDPVSGLPVLTAGPGAPVLTSEEVAEILADFP